MRRGYLIVLPLVFAMPTLRECDDRPIHECEVVTSAGGRRSAEGTTPRREAMSADNTLALQALTVPGDPPARFS